MKEAIKRLRSIGEKGMRGSDYCDVTDSLALYRQDLELVLSVHNDVARYLEITPKPEYRPLHGEPYNLYHELRSKVGKL